MARKTVKRSDPAGFTLLEAMLAILLLTTLMLWTMQCVLTVYAVSTRNLLRDEGVKLTEQLLTDERNRGYANLSAGTTTLAPVQKQIRSYQQSYQVERKVIDEVPGLAYSVTITVTWSYRGTSYNVKSTTIIGDV